MTTFHPYWIGAPSGVALILAVLALSAALVVVGRLDRAERPADPEDDAS